MKHLYKEVIVTLEAPRKKEEETKEQYKQRVLNSAKAFAEYQQAEVISIHPILAKKTSKSIIHMKRKDILLDDRGLYHNKNNSLIGNLREDYKKSYKSLKGLCFFQGNEKEWENAILYPKKRRI